MQTPSATLAHFAANTVFADIPPSVIRKTEDLLVDWVGSVVAGHGARAVESIAQFARAAGPITGPSEQINARRGTSAFFAAMANAAASHVAEQDDVHNGSVFHPATIVFPAALAVAQEIGASGKDFLTAAVVGYEVGIRVGEYLGRPHYRIFHTTGTAGTLAAAATVGSLLKLTPDQMLHAFGSAGTMSAGLWEFLRTAADSKQLHTAHAASTGLMAATLAKDQFTGATQILEGAQGMGAGMSSNTDVACLTDGLGQRWATAETSFKYHASCRHTHPAADALLAVMQAHGLQVSDIADVETRVHQGAVDVLGPVVNPSTVHQSKFSMGTVLALVAQFGHAGLSEFDGHFQTEVTTSFCAKVRMVVDGEVDTAYPKRWIGKVVVRTNDGRLLDGRVDEPKGDPGNTLSRDEITAKALRLAHYSGGVDAQTMTALIDRLWGVAEWDVVPHLLPQAR